MHKLYLTGQENSPRLIKTNIAGFNKIYIISYHAKNLKYATLYKLQLFLCISILRTATPANIFLFTLSLKQKKTKTRQVAANQQILIFFFKENIDCL